MNVQQLLASLDAHDTLPLRFHAPFGACIPPHFHVTEVGRVVKDFIDCGGQRRRTLACMLQVWSANDVDHRLSAGKLAKIIRMAEPILESLDLPVEIEYGENAATHYQLSEIGISAEGLTLQLAGKKTDCLAPDKCGISLVNLNGGCC